ncbi:efflux transporter outer membrane subunit [Ferrovum sp. PN-J185]|uniref:efflux transporter outer membrane subunit n=1 Tax=Ferrovum sp. PN-J185 TaxID=1356306 RepID=UPI00079C0277|nr:efflux transporter outer membrane subunit [Ferrovum sp. PN-J185]KXW56975.1 toluene efflux pump outer membrane protein TtgI precursor [Ferrovum sp. PN-J185]
MQKKFFLFISLLEIVMLTGCNSTTPFAYAFKKNDNPDDFVQWVPRVYKDQTYESKLTVTPSEDDKIVQTNPKFPKMKDLWWKEFNSTELNDLVETAISKNFDLQIAITRIDQAEKNANIAKSYLMPTIGIFAGETTSGPALGAGTATSLSNYNNLNVYEFGFRATYEVDLWNKLHYQRNSALELLKASKENRDVVALTLISDVVTTYFEVLSLRERILIANNNLKIANSVQQAIQTRLKSGEATELELQQQEVTIVLVENAIATLELQKQTAEDHLAILLGTSVDNINIKKDTLQGIIPPKIKLGIPSDLLCRRPDIRLIEYQLKSSNENVKAARANLLPTFSLTDEYGQASQNLTQIMSPYSLLYSFSINAFATVFDGGKLVNQLDLEKAKNRELIAQYSNTIINALRDVQDALAAIKITSIERAELEKALNKTKNLLKLSTLVYQSGAMDYVSLQVVQRDVFNSQDAEAKSRFDQLRSTVNLFKALGGGLTSKNDTCTLKNKNVVGSSQ